MSTHISENLPRLLTGDASRDETLAAADHLRSCPDCQQELVSAVVAHASLTSAHRFAPEVVAPAPSADDVGEFPSGPLPDMTAVFAKVREEATERPRNVGNGRRRILAVAAAAVVLAGGGVTIAETVGSGSSSPAGRTVALHAFDTGTAPATARVQPNGRVHIDASKLPRLDPAHAYEVWLTDPGRTQMVQVGFLGTDNRADLTVTPKVMAHYGDIEVSRQPADQTVRYSGISVLRGSYG